MTVDQDDPRLDNMMITASDAVRAGHCARGIKTWCEKHGIDPRVFITKGGLPAREILAKGDALGERVVALKLAWLYRE